MWHPNILKRKRLSLHGLKGLVLTRQVHVSIPQLFSEHQTCLSYYLQHITPWLFQRPLQLCLFICHILYLRDHCPLPGMVSPAPPQSPGHHHYHHCPLVRFCQGRLLDISGVCCFFTVQTTSLSLRLFHQSPDPHFSRYKARLLTYRKL